MGADPCHHPHVLCIVPGGGLGADGRWVACKANFFLPVHVLSREDRRLFLERLQRAFDAGDLAFFGDLAPLRARAAFTARLRPLRTKAWVVYAKRPFAGSAPILEYLGRYTHRVAIANGRLTDCEGGRVGFRWKDYRARGKSGIMRLDADEFMRRFLLHVLPSGFRRIRHFGFLANVHRTARLAQIRAALAAPEPPPKIKPGDYRERTALLVGRCLDVCRLCGGHMIETAPSRRERPKPSKPERCDTS